MAAACPGTWPIHASSSAYVKKWQSATEEAGHIFKGKRASLHFAPKSVNLRKLIKRQHALKSLV